jgi:hypothetical protein
MVAANDRGGNVRIAMAGTKKLNGDLTLLELLFQPAGSQPATAHTGETGTAKSTATGGSDAAPVGGAVGGKPSTVGGQPSTGNAGSTTPGSEGRTAQAAKSAVSADDTPVQLVWIVLNEILPAKLTPAAGGAQGERANLPTEFFLSPPVPNPFGSGTMVSFGLPRESYIRVCVFDAAGRLARTLAKGARPAGRYSLVWDGKDNRNRQLTSGIYFVRLETIDFQSERKAVLLRQ